MPAPTPASGWKRTPKGATATAMARAQLLLGTAKAISAKLGDEERRHGGWREGSATSTVIVCTLALMMSGFVRVACLPNWYHSSGVGFRQVYRLLVSRISVDEEVKLVGRCAGRSWQIVSLRTLQGGFGQGRVFGPPRRLDVQKFFDTLALAERLTRDPTAENSLLLFLEATTHLADAEYAQSYVMAWTILEMSIAALWRHVLTEKGIKGKRLGKLLQPDRWSTDDIIESLSLVNALPIEDYEELIRLKRARNSMLHRGKQVTREEAERCLNFALVWLKRMLPENGGQTVHRA